MDESYNHLKINIEAIYKMNRLLIYNTMTERSHKDNVNVGINYRDLNLTLECIKNSMEEYKEIKREEMNKKENMDEELIESFREADELEELKRLREEDLSVLKKMES